MQQIISLVRLLCRLLDDGHPILTTVVSLHEILSFWVREEYQFCGFCGFHHTVIPDVYKRQPLGSSTSHPKPLDRFQPNLAQIFYATGEPTQDMCFFDMILRGVLLGVLWGLPHLLLNHWTDFNQTWHKYFTQRDNQHRIGVFFDGVHWGAVSYTHLK